MSHWLGEGLKYLASDLSTSISPSQGETVSCRTKKIFLGSDFFTSVYACLWNLNFSSEIKKTFVETTMYTRSYPLVFLRSFNTIKSRNHIIFSFYIIYINTFRDKVHNKQLSK